MINLGQMQVTMETPDTSTEGPTTRIEFDNGVSFSINEGSLPLSIGRDSSCDIRIASGHVSRHHCELFRRDGRLFLRDTSSNGTTVDNRVVRQSSVTIDRRTPVLLADEIKMVLTPLDEASVEPASASDGAASAESVNASAADGAASGRRERRRGYDRRQRNIVVSFDRRSGAGERRGADGGDK